MPQRDVRLIEAYIAPKSPLMGLGTVGVWSEVPAAQAVDVQAFVILSV